MRSPHLIRARWIVAALALVSVASAESRGQLITPRTVPIHQGEQFEIFPLQWPGMGGVSIALPDTLGDVWSNPAKASRLRVGSVQVAPFTHTATSGGGRSIPVSLLQTGGSFAGGMLFSLQEIERRDTWWNLPISDRRASNMYIAGVLARRLSRGLSIGTSVSIADLGGVDGVGALYASSDRVRQSGSQVDARLGLTRDFGNGATLELVAVGYQYRMTHDVHYPETWRWPPCGICPQFAPCECTPVSTPARTEVNLDRTNAAGVHAVYLAPPSAQGWRVGYLFTANRLTHPKIPNYQLQNIPRDPGNTNAFNAGVGLLRSVGRSTFGLDVMLEPMRSHTWADAAHDTMDVDGGLLRAGAHTVDNNFRFTNARIAVGFAHELAASSDSAFALGFQGGVGMRAIRYTLDQANHVTKASRVQDEAWTEWSPAFAVTLRNHDITVSYARTYTCGPSCFSVDNQVFFVAEAAPATPGVIAAPSEPLTFDGGSSGTHRITVSIRMR